MVLGIDEYIEVSWKLICLNTIQMGRSAGFTLGGSYGQHRQQQHQGSPIMSTSAAPGSFSGGNSSDLLQMHSAADVFQVLHIPICYFQKVDSCAEIK